MYKINNIRVKKVNIKTSGIVAFANVEYAGLILSGIAIHEKLNSKEYRITYPIRKDAHGEREFNVFNPINKETSKILEDAIINKYVKLYGSNSLRNIK